jgi:hypothetical protein
VQPVSYRGRLVAGVATDEMVLSSQIAELEDDHPRRRFVLAMCILATERVRSQRPCDDAAAERFARILLMPERVWRRAAGYCDLELAEAFNVPLEQVRRRRTELARAGWWQLAPEAI